MPAVPRIALQPRKTPSQRRSQVTVEAILDATLQVLRREGLARFTTTRVAEVAGVSVGTLYQYFPNKRALVAEVVRRHMALIERQLVSALDGGGDLDTQARRLVAAFVAVKREHLATSLALRGPKQDADGARIVRQGMRRLHATLLDRWRGLVPPRTGGALDERLWLLLAAVDGIASFVIEEQPALLEAAVFERTLLDVTAAVLQARPATTRPTGTGRPGARRARRPRTGA